MLLLKLLAERILVERLEETIVEDRNIIGKLVTEGKQLTDYIHELTKRVALSILSRGSLL